MHNNAIPTLIVASAFGLIQLGECANAMTLDAYVLPAFNFEVATGGYRSAPQPGSVIRWADSSARTAIAEDWAGETILRNTDMVSAFVRSGVSPDTGLKVVGAALAILERNFVSIADVQIDIVQDSEDDFAMAEVCFLIDDDFDSVMIIDRKLTKSLVKEMKIPYNLSVTARELSSIVA